MRSQMLEGEFAASESEEEPPDGLDPDMPMIMEGMKKEDWLWLAEYDCFRNCPLFTMARGVKRRQGSIVRRQDTKCISPSDFIK